MAKTSGHPLERADGATAEDAGIESSFGQAEKVVVRPPGLEPGKLSSSDFKSDAFTNFAMAAEGEIVLRSAIQRLVAEPRVNLTS
jgi:hypothetical protein